jgi:hypothetical protein
MGKPIDNGVSRGNVQRRVTILGGILQGLKDFKEETCWIRDRLERQVIIACAEIIEDVDLGESAENISRLPGCLAGFE